MMFAIRKCILLQKTTIFLVIKIQQQKNHGEILQRYKLNFHLAPPAIAKKNDKGELVKQKFGPWMLSAFGLLAGLKGLRGGALDFFGRTEERKTERALIDEYMRCIDELVAGLSAERLAQAVEIARIPEEIRGYGHVKERHLVAARAKWATLMAAWRGGAVQGRKAA